jgi:hypothetical protein
MTALDLAEADFDAESLALIDTARETARSLDHGYVGTEHLLLAAAQLLPEVRTALSDHGLAGRDRLSTELQRMVDAHPEWSPYIADDDALAAIGVDGPAVREKARAEFGELFTPAEPGACRQPAGATDRRRDRRTRRQRQCRPSAGRGAGLRPGGTVARTRLRGCSVTPSRAVRAAAVAAPP